MESNPITSSQMKKLPAHEDHLTIVQCMRQQVHDKQSLGRISSEMQRKIMPCSRHIMQFWLLQWKHEHSSGKVAWLFPPNPMGKCQRRWCSRKDVLREVFPLLCLCFLPLIRRESRTLQHGAYLSGTSKPIQWRRHCNVLACSCTV